MITEDFLPFIMVLFAVWNHGRSYPQGPPASACQTMMPQHYAEPQTTESPYNITVHPTAYKYFNITVSLYSPSDIPFKGYMLQLRMVSERDRIFDGFSLLGSGKRIKCGADSEAVTQNEGGDKHAVRFKWQPVDNLGDIQFVASVVKDLRTFWTDIKSPVLKYDYNLKPDPTDKTTTTQATPMDGKTTTKATPMNDRTTTRITDGRQTEKPDSGQKTISANVEITILLGFVAPFIL